MRTAEICFIHIVNVRDAKRFIYRNEKEFSN